MPWYRKPLATHAGYRLIDRDLHQERRQHLRIALALVCHLHGADLQGFRIDAQMHLAPLPAILRAMLLGFPLAFAQHFDPSAIHQQMQRA
ncbi:hypothetical protein BI347_10490 [Chromobacterium sphagni]|uniref:Uncharacterized protein n=1 Tax=Chromobacterium sphagni TaxID=1903179 RepID=A0A1S1X398_9NEIS|nr:hypothetical protein BI347_10490 [Chromobacterium sphagni]